MVAGKDGVVNVKLLNHHGLIIAGRVEGRMSFYYSSLIKANGPCQVYTQDGPPLSMDIKLRLAFHVSALHPVPVLCGGWNVLS